MSTQNTVVSSKKKKRNEDSDVLTAIKRLCAMKAAKVQELQEEIKTLECEKEERNRQLDVISQNWKAELIKSAENPETAVDSAVQLAAKFEPEMQAMKSDIQGCHIRWDTCVDLKHKMEQINTDVLKTVTAALKEIKGISTKVNMTAALNKLEDISTKVNKDDQAIDLCNTNVQ